jgi:hypothetical protein
MCGVVTWDVIGGGDSARCFHSRPIKSPTQCIKHKSLRCGLLLVAVPLSTVIEALGRINGGGRMHSTVRVSALAR